MRQLGGYRRAGAWHKLGRTLLFVLFACMSLPFGASPILADGTDQAAIVLRFGDGQYVVRTVEAGESLSGLELLEGSGLPVVTNTEWGSPVVCKIGPDGCPASECFTCAQPNYWQYWHWEDDHWRSSGVGASAWTVTAGMIDGWTWGGDLPVIDAASVFDVNRLMPGLPEVTSSDGSLQIQLDFAGDENENAAASARYRSPNGQWSDPGVTLLRVTQSFSGVVATGLAPGSYEIGVDYVDPDGINGSASWVITTTVETMNPLYLPLIVK